MKTFQIILKDFKFDSLGLQKGPGTHVNPLIGQRDSNYNNVAG